jgi:DNA helicase-2/ATP-dependent DNA helicase PcrA
VLGPQDVREVRVGDHVLLTLDQVWKTVEKYQLRGVAAGPRLTALVEEDLVEKLERRISQLAGTDAIYTEMFALSDDEQERIFGYDVQLSNVADDELRDYSVTYLDDLCAPAFDAVHDAAWLRIDRIGMQMLGQKSITGSEWLFLKMALVGQRDDRTKFVMVDEVQDYTAAQLTVLARYFGRAHFLLLGDPNQAIRPDTASWDEIRAVFEAERGGVADCSLMTSYRSSPEITDLFASLLPAEERIQISSVMRPGEAPRRAAFASKDAYLDALVEAVRAGAACEGGLTALVCRDRGGAKRLEKLLAERMGAEAPVLLREKMSLPEAGVVLIDLPLAKGLEFDRVVVADASEDVYPTGDDLARRCLYTAISRATQQASLLAWGELTGLLG